MNEEPGRGQRWRVPPQQTVVKAVATVVVAVLAVLSVDDRQLLLLSGVAAIGLAGLTLRDLLAPVRVAADAEGVTVVTGYAGHRHLPWGEITAIRVDERTRLLMRTRLLEIETGDDVHMFSFWDLGEDVQDTAAALDRLRAAHGPALDG